ncbi:hypothetical protein CBR_g19255 [Chara braunii]|uniref:Bromo domain-containing protein n=1 Tax=Chara braunii TaxID=69332 RepID=A0A388JTN4_CHABU|nr:hypothetical protein CBR_g19255 [Chara braunii]|eukprot:GBG61179.1 hypothetical protein CBR_g19255 [Chara braunii]
MGNGCCRAKKWQTIWQRMKNYDPKTTDSSFQLKCHYVRYLYAYEQKKVLGKEAKLDIPELTRKFGTNCIVKSIPGAASLFGDQQLAVRTKREPPRKRDRELNAKRKLARSSSRVRLPYKRPFYKLALQQHEIEQDLALILNSKRRRTTRGASHQAMGAIDDMSACTMLLLRLRNHEHGGEFNRPVPMSSWPQVAKDRYLQLVSSPIDLSMIQARLSCGEYNHPVLFADDVRLVFRNAAMCAEGESGLMKRTIELWQLFEKEVVVHGIAAAEPIAVPPMPGQGEGPTTARSKTLEDNTACCDRLPGFRVSPLRKPLVKSNNTGLVLKMMYAPAVGDPALDSAKPRTKGKIFRKPKKLLSYEAIVNGSRLIQDQQNSAASEGKSWDTGCTSGMHSSVALSSPGTDSRLVVKLSHAATKGADFAKVPVGKRSLHQLSKVDESSAYVSRTNFDHMVAPIATVPRLGSNRNIRGRNNTVEAADEPEVVDAPAAEEVPSCREASTREQNTFLNKRADGRIDRWNAEPHKEEQIPKSRCESTLSVCSTVTRVTGVTRVGAWRTAGEKVPAKLPEQITVRREKSGSGKGCGGKSAKRGGQLFPFKVKVQVEHRKSPKKSATEGGVSMSPSEEDVITCSETTVVSSFVQASPVGGEGGDDKFCIAQVERMHTGRSRLEELKGRYSPGFGAGPLMWKKSRPRPCSQSLPKCGTYVVPLTTTLLTEAAVSTALLPNRGSDATHQIPRASGWQQEDDREEGDRGGCPMMEGKAMSSLSEGTRAHYDESVSTGSEQLNYLNNEKRKGVRMLDSSGACVREHQQQGLNSSQSEWAMPEENKQRDGSAGGGGRAQEADAWDMQSGKSYRHLPDPRSTGNLLMEPKSPSTFSSLLPSIQPPQNWKMTSHGTTGTLSWNMACL